MLLAQNGPCYDTVFFRDYYQSVLFFVCLNTFTPNNDGKNDYFQPTGLGISEYKIYIYNRWGEEVFYSDNINLCWDGGKESLVLFLCN